MPRPALLLVVAALVTAGCLDRGGEARSGEGPAPAPVLDAPGQLVPTDATWPDVPLDP